MVAEQRIIGRVNKLTQYIKALADLSNLNHDLVFDRGNGGLPQREDKYRVVIAKPKVEHGIRYRQNESNGDWEIGFFSSLGAWELIDIKETREAARDEAIRLMMIIINQ